MNPITALQRQLSARSKKLTISEHSLSTIHSYPMNSEIGNHACPAAEHYIKSWHDQNVGWRDTNMYGEQSIIATIRLFRDKSQTYSRAGALLFCHLHITVVNFIAGTHRELFEKKSTVLAALPVNYEANGEHGLSSKVHSVHKNMAVLKNYKR